MALLTKQPRTYSLRLPPAQFVEVQRLADAEERSVNQILVHLISEALLARQKQQGHQRRKTVQHD